MNLTAKDLMIGDWVEMNLSPSTSQQYYFKSKIVVSNLVSLENGYDFDAKPIPLTPEILDANGLYLANNGYYIFPFKTTTLYFLECRVFEDCVVINLEKDLEGTHTGINRVHLIAHYVHELQHALRLCGLAELADNLKLN